MSLDSAEFLIETTYNYEVARINDSLQTEYHAFSFDVPVTNDSLLSETEVSDYMYRIKDSMMVTWNNVTFEGKDLSLFDLEIDHQSGNTNATFTVHYTITSGAVKAWQPLTNLTINGAVEDAWAVQNPPCGYKFYSIYPSYASPYRWINPYYFGTGTLNYTSNYANPIDCSQPGAATLLRAYGINNYFAAYGMPSRVYVPLNITLTQDFWPTTVSTNHDYTNRGYTYYSNTDQYDVTVPDNGSGTPNYSNRFYAQWLNTAMMNFYLGYIPVKLHNGVPSGKYFCDFQISQEAPGTISTWHFSHVYHVFSSDLSDLARNEQLQKALPNF